MFGTLILNINKRNSFLPIYSILQYNIHHYLRLLLRHLQHLAKVAERLWSDLDTMRLFQCLFYLTKNQDLTLTLTKVRLDYMSKFLSLTL